MTFVSPHVLPDWWVEQNAWDFWLDYEAGIWEPETHEWIAEYVRPGSTYVDVGAWIGPTVLWAAPLAGRVVAVEPDPVAQDYFRQNVAGWPNVELVAAALAGVTGTVRLAPHVEGWGSSMSRLADTAPNPGVATWDTGGAIDVEALTMADLFDRYKLTDVSLVKMDIEGAEADVLGTVCPFLAERKIPFLVSLHDTWWSSPVDRSVFDCFSELRGVWPGPAPLLALP